jgi:hypothetical protein
MERVARMQDIRIYCEGVTTGPLWVPPFQLRVEDFICLHMPCLSNSKEERLVVELLTGELPDRRISLSGRVLLADPPVCPAGFFGLFRRTRVANWLQRKASIPAPEARAIASRLGLHGDDQVCRLPGNPRALLGLEAAYARGAEAIIFSTVGIDFRGRKAVHESVLSRIDQCPAIHLSFQYWTQGRLERFCHPRARCIDVTQRPGTGTLKEYVESNPHAFRPRTG